MRWHVVSNNGEREVTKAQEKIDNVLSVFITTRLCDFMNIALTWGNDPLGRL